MYPLSGVPRVYSKISWHTGMPGISLTLNGPWLQISSWIGSINRAWIVGAVTWMPIASLDRALFPSTLAAMHEYDFAG